MSKFVFLVLMILSSSLFAKHKVVWVEIHYPPLYNNDPKDLGIHNQIIKFLEDDLGSKYEFENILTSNARMAEFLTRSTDKVTYCVPGGPEIPQPGVSYIKDPLFMLPGEGLIVRKFEGYPLTNDPVDLQALIRSRKNIKIGYVRGGYYAPQITAMFKEFPNNFEAYTDPSPAKAVKMLAHKRMDAFLIFPFVFMYERIKKPNGANKNLMFLAVEQANNQIKSKVFCSSTDKGKQVLKDFDGVLAKQEVKEKILGVLKPYQSYKNSKPSEIDTQSSALQNGKLAQHP